jgi:hypothetical protein
VPDALKKSAGQRQKKYDNFRKIKKSDGILRFLQSKNFMDGIRKICGDRWE